MMPTTVSRGRMLWAAGAALAALALAGAGLAIVGAQQPEVTTVENEPGIRRICLPLPYRLGTVNCYLVWAGDGYVLIDAGPASQRANLEDAQASVARLNSLGVHTVYPGHGEPFAMAQFTELMIWHILVGLKLIRVGRLERTALAQ